MFKIVITILLIVISAASLAVATTPPPTEIDSILVWTQAAGFPAWAGVVAWASIKVISELKDIGNKLEAHIVGTERRLSLLEFKIMETK